MFKKGQSGNPSGRPKGIISKKTKFKYDVANIAQIKGCNPFEILADLAMNSPKERMRYDAAKELCSYLAPKLKSMQLQNESSAPVQVMLSMDGIIKELNPVAPGDTIDASVTGEQSSEDTSADSVQSDEHSV